MVNGILIWFSEGYDLTPSPHRVPWRHSEIGTARAMGLRRRATDRVDDGGNPRRAGVAAKPAVVRVLVRRRHPGHGGEFAVGDVRQDLRRRADDVFSPVAAFIDVLDPLCGRTVNLHHQLSKYMGTGEPQELSGEESPRA